MTFASSGTAERAGPSDMGATAISEIDTDIKTDAQAQFERVQQILKEDRDDKVCWNFNFFYKILKVWKLNACKFDDIVAGFQIPNRTDHSIK